MNYCESCKHSGNCKHEWRYSKLVYGCEKYAKVMTNEEWLKSCTTEELADVFFDYRYINATPQQRLWMSANEDFAKGGIVEWLKQPHPNE